MRVSTCLLVLFVGLVAAVAQAQDARLTTGRRIDLICDRTLSTEPQGGALGLIGVKPVTRENSTMVFRVAHDVFSEDGTLMIQAGAPATGTVIDSQVGGGFKPHAPRLAVTVDRVLTVDGVFLPIRFTQRHEGRWAKVFSREETGAWANRNQATALEQLSRMPRVNPEIRELMGIVFRGEAPSLIQDPVKVLQLEYVARQSGLPNIVRFLQKGRWMDIVHLVADIESGAFAIRSLADLHLLADAYQIVSDTYRAGTELVQWMHGRLLAPQIIVPAGYPVEAVVAQPLPELGNQLLQW